jgi:DnaJ-class molecular chaperone
MAVLNYYEVLQVSAKAELEVIQAAYKRLAFKYHPDRDRDPSSHERMQLLNDAHAVLSDPVRRAKHDRELMEQTKERTNPEHKEASSSSQSNAASPEENAIRRGHALFSKGSHDLARLFRF